MKLDAAGNELAVLRGGRSLLEQGSVESIICKLYHPRVVAERFGEKGDPHATVAFLHACGYEVIIPGGNLADAAMLDDVFSRGAYSIPALASNHRGKAAKNILERGDCS
jgi:hypothetical protein